jgi:tetratricopeptide (TPR) repeat protein
MANGLKLLLVLALLFVFVLVAQAQETPLDVMSQANTAYETGDYVTAIRLYENLLGQGIRDSSLFFNLGNAYYQTRDLGKTLVNYLRAQQLAPRDAELNTNLSLVRAQRLDIQGDAAAIIDNLVDLTTSALTTMELGWIALGLWALWFFLLSLLIIRPGWRSVMRAPLLILGVVALIGVFLFGSRLLSASSRAPAVIIAKTTPILSGPGEQYLVNFELHNAAEIRVLEIRDDWALFVLPDGRQGWIARDAFEFV